jgi:hypothetical protein
MFFFFSVCVTCHGIFQARLGGLADDALHVCCTVRRRLVVGVLMAVSVACSQTRFMKNKDYILDYF